MRIDFLMPRLAAILAITILTGCAAKGPGPLYMWEKFPRQQYGTLLRDGANLSEQIQSLEAHAEKARAANTALPPGFRAHLGMLYMDTGNAQRAKELWQAEVVAFPEASPYMDRLLKQLDNATPISAKANPA
jgi:hypothetical protein